MKDGMGSTPREDVAAWLEGRGAAGVAVGAVIFVIALVWMLVTS